MARFARRFAQNTRSLKWLASLGASRKTLGPGAPNQLTASEAAEADLIWPMSPAPMGRGHMQSFNLLGQTVSESSVYTRVQNKGNANI